MREVEAGLGGYAPWPALVAGPLRDAPRAEADAFFAWFLEARPARLSQLAGLIPATAAAAIGTAQPDDQVVAVGEAALALLRRETYAAFGDERAAAVTAFVGDLGIWLGERVLRAAPALSWRLFTSHKKATGYQRPVLMGFPGLDPAYYVDVGFFVASWAELAARGRLARADFLRSIETSALADAMRTSASTS